MLELLSFQATTYGMIGGLNFAMMISPHDPAKKMKFAGNIMLKRE